MNVQKDRQTNVQTLLSEKRGGETSVKTPVADLGLPRQRAPNEKGRVRANIGGSRGGVRDARPPLGVQILSISCSFREKFGVFTPPLEGSRPPSGKSWIRHWLKFNFGNFSQKIHRNWTENWGREGCR